MKKIITAIIASFFIGNFALAETSIGVKISAASMDASGSHTTNSSSGGSGGDAVNASGEADFNMGSFFIEKNTGLDFNGVGITIGLDVIPFTAEVDKLGGGDGFDATVDVEDVMTAYIQPTFSTGDGVSVFARLGYTQGDVVITNITRQATASETTDSASTDGDQSKSLEGIMYGVGITKEIDGLVDFLRLEGTITEFDEIQHTNSNGKVVKADSELMLISLSIGKTF